MVTTTSDFAPRIADDPLIKPHLPTRGFVNFVFGGFDEVITGLSIASNTGFSGTIVSNFSFTPNSITLDMSSGNRTINSVLVFDIATAAVPEPTSLALLGIAIAGLGFSRRKQ